MAAHTLKVTLEFNAQTGALLNVFGEGSTSPTKPFVRSTKSVPLKRIFKVGIPKKVVIDHPGGAGCQPPTPCQIIIAGNPYCVRC